MNKAIFTAAVLAAMCVGGYFGHSAYQESKLTNLELANVEALSDDEGASITCTAPGADVNIKYCHHADYDKHGVYIGCVFDGSPHNICMENIY